MTEESELQAKIAALSGKINQHKQHQQSPVRNLPHAVQSQYSPVNPSRGRGRWSPYTRGGRAGYSIPHKNRTLYLGGTAQAPASPEPKTAIAADAEAAAAIAPLQSNGTETFVSTRGRGKNQLMNKDTYVREQNKMQEHQEKIRNAKRQRSYNKETAKLLTALKVSSAQSHHVMTVDGLRFQLREDGSKLFRLKDGEETSRETPKKVTIAGVDFHRTKNGNLVRAKAIRNLASTLGKAKSKQQCQHFTKHGHCTLGPACNFMHDPNKVAICKTFLHTGACPAGDECDLSHEPTYHRVSACTHFLRGNCTNDKCRYPHVHVSPTAPVCKPFATVGYCSDGPLCDKRHVVECPDYSNTGYCADQESGKCQLPHIDRAANMRKAAERQTKNHDDDDESDSSSDADEQQDLEMHDVDSDEADIIMGIDDGNQSMSQQHDFVPLS